jgi:ferredoxin
VGCGACEFACPVRDRPAIYVTSVGESRSNTNQLLLRQPAKPDPYFPATNEVPGWIKSGNTRVFDAADLWKYVDGDAERYLQAGVQQTFTANYRYQNRLEAVADVHVMSAAKGAVAIFESEPAAGRRPIPLGDGGRSYGQSVTFRRNRYFVRLVGYEDSPKLETALVILARGIEARLAEEHR